MRRHGNLPKTWGVAFARWTRDESSRERKTCVALCYARRQQLNNHACSKMCGIAGILCSDRARVALALGRITDAESHRGPDDSGQEVVSLGDRFLGLGHRRLSILDLSAAGHQPMRHPRTGDWLVFNGEIYNFAVLRGEL